MLHKRSKVEENPAQDHGLIYLAVAFALAAALAVILPSPSHMLF